MSRLASIFALVAMLASASFGQITFGTGGDGVIVSTNRLSYGTNFTFCAWVCPNKAALNENTYGGIIISDRSGNVSSGDRNSTLFYSKTAGYVINWFAGATVNFAALPAADVIDGKWVHLVGTCNGDAKKVCLFVNGTLVSSVDISGTPDTNSVKCVIGNLAWSALAGEYQWRGSIQDVRIYSRVLTAAEIATMALHPWALADDPAMILRTAIDGKPTGVALTGAAKNYGTQAISPMTYQSAVTSVVTRVQIAKPLQMELP